MTDTSQNDNTEVERLTAKRDALRHAIARGGLEKHPAALASVRDELHRVEAWLAVARGETGGARNADR